MAYARMLLWKQHKHRNFHHELQEVQRHPMGSACHSYCGGGSRLMLICVVNVCLLSSSRFSVSLSLSQLVRLILFLQRMPVVGSGPQREVEVELAVENVMTLLGVGVREKGGGEERGEEKRERAREEKRERAREERGKRNGKERGKREGRETGKRNGKEKRERAREEKRERAREERGKRNGKRNGKRQNQERGGENTGARENRRRAERQEGPAEQEAGDRVERESSGVDGSITARGHKPNPVMVSRTSGPSRLAASLNGVALSPVERLFLYPLLYSLYTYDCAATSSSITIVKFADDTVVMGLILDNDERAHLTHLENWCQEDHLLLNVRKTKELIVDCFKKQERHYQPVRINGTTVERVGFRRLGRIRDFGLPSKVLQNFYTCTIDSILMGNITVWFGNYTKQDRQALQSVVRASLIQNFLTCRSSTTSGARPRPGGPCEGPPLSQQQDLLSFEPPSSGWDPGWHPFLKVSGRPKDQTGEQGRENTKLCRASRTTLPEGHGTSMEQEAVECVVFVVEVVEMELVVEEEVEVEVLVEVVVYSLTCVRGASSLRLRLGDLEWGSEMPRFLPAHAQKTGVTAAGPARRGVECSGSPAEAHSKPSTGDSGGGGTARPTGSWDPQEMFVEYTHLFSSHANARNTLGVPMTPKAVITDCLLV
ncbi:hypothetical protein P4O66_012696 [Electrophorus voltai]|uniref:Reverse transcriptase domain-containing protein n=1 Tax=Electrophorus voltai TaxID=2609070 RepID=A0AAD8Z567_9TELE|nr:hypothetical protein P4O66_012696 [Electrophorus voltai]